MSSDLDLTGRVRSWLRTDEHESADRVLADVLGLLDTTPQRHALSSVRTTIELNTYARLAIAAAAVVVAVVGINLVSGGGDRGSRPAVSPSPSASPTSRATPSSTPEVDPYSADFGIGRHSLTVDGVPLSFSTTTSGWEPYGSLLISKSERGPQGAEAIIFWASLSDGLDAGPCAPMDGPPIGSVADVAAVVSKAPGTELVGGPSVVTVGGRPAGHAVVTVRADVGCDPGFFYNWKARNGGALWVRSELGDKIRVWIVDVDGKRLFIGGETRADASPRLEQEVQQIVDSIEFR